MNENITVPFVRKQSRLMVQGVRGVRGVIINQSISLTVIAHISSVDFWTNTQCFIVGCKVLWATDASIHTGADHYRE